MKNTIKNTIKAAAGFNSVHIRIGSATALAHALTIWRRGCRWFFGAAILNG